MIKMWQPRAALKVALEYLKSPYTLIDGTEYSEYAHDHICFARRLIGSNFKYVCPHYNTGELDELEWSDCCDLCKYFGIINFYKDENDKKNINFVMHKSIVDTFED